MVLSKLVDKKALSFWKVSNFDEFWNTLSLNHICNVKFRRESGDIVVMKILSASTRLCAGLGVAATKWEFKQVGTPPLTVIIVISSSRFQLLAHILVNIAVFISFEIIYLLQQSLTNFALIGVPVIWSISYLSILCRKACVCGIKFLDKFFFLLKVLSLSNKGAWHEVEECHEPTNKSKSGVKSVDYIFVLHG